MCVKWGLNIQGSCRFSLHTLFSWCAHHCFVSLSLKPNFKEIEHIIKLWTFHILIILKKITVIKPLIVSKLNHLLQAFLRPSMALTKEFNYKIFSFILDNTSEMLYHNQHVLEVFKMLNPEMYSKDLKLSTIRRNFKSSSKIIKFLPSSANIDNSNLE